MAVTNFTSLLGLALPTTGDLSGTWGTVVNNSITSLLDSAIAGTTTLSTDADVTLSITNGASNQARAAILLWTATGTVTRNITAPAQSKVYAVINATGGSQSIVIRGTGPTTGVTVAAGERCIVVWNGSDFTKVASSSTTFNGGIVINGTSLSGGSVTLGEDTDNGSNTVTIKAASSIPSDVTFTLPSADGANGQAVTTNGSGTLGFTTLTTPGKAIALSMIFGF